jgi:hypothetical protein
MEVITASEYQECRAFWQMCQYHPILKDYLIHIPNQGERSIAYYNALKSIGFRSGAPDYLLPVHAHRYHSLWLEMKKKGVKRHSQLQDMWLSKLNAIGNLALYVYGADEAYQTCIDYLDNKL